MKIHNIEQGTPEWHEIRKGKMTASHAQAIGNCGKGLDTYIVELMSTYYSHAEPENYTNADMERGNELEPLARNFYQMETKNKVEEVGFIEMDEYVGVSPDGLVDEKGMIEIKSVNDKNHFKLMLDGEKMIESKYIWQMQMQMLVAERDWVDYVSYNPNFKKSIIIFRIEKDPVKQEKLLQGIEIGKEKIISIKEILK